MKQSEYFAVKVIFLFAVAFISGCTQPESGAGGPCDGGIAAEGTCLRIEKIVPFNATEDTSDVDVVRNLDCDEDPLTNGRADDEPFTNHLAKVTFDSRLRLPDSGDPGRDVTLGEYTIRYDLVKCPAGLTCPSVLTPLNVSETLFIPAKGRLEDVTVQLAPIALRGEYLAKSGGLLALYSATYTFKGEDQLGEAVSLSGSTTITLGDFDNCVVAPTTTTPPV